MVESTRLESERAGNRTGGSNPPLSATIPTPALSNRTLRRSREKGTIHLGPHRLAWHPVEGTKLVAAALGV